MINFLQPNFKYIFFWWCHIASNFTDNFIINTNTPTLSIKTKMKFNLV